MLTRQRKWPKSEWKRREKRVEGVRAGGEREKGGRGEREEGGRGGGGGWERTRRWVKGERGRVKGVRVGGERGGWERRVGEDREEGERRVGGEREVDKVRCCLEPVVFKGCEEEPK